MKRIAVLGDGAWGTAVAQALAHKGQTVFLWCYDPKIQQEIQQHHKNDRYLPNITLSSLIIPSTDMAQVVSDVDIIIEAIPVQFMRSVLQKVCPYVKNNQRWIILSKGLEQHTLLFPSGILDDCLPYTAQKAIVAGPSFARDLAQGCLTATVVASHDSTYAQEVSALLSSEFWRLSISDDDIGVQVGAAVKNVIALGLGILQGAKYADNTQAYMVTAALGEMVLLAEYLGGKCETIYGLAGVGDLLLSILGSQSRNIAIGRLIGEGKKLDEILGHIAYVPEGINSMYALEQLCIKHTLKLPMLQRIYAIVNQQCTINQCFAPLL